MCIGERKAQMVIVFEIFLINLLIKKSLERIAPFLVKGVVNIKFWDLSPFSFNFSAR